MCGIVGVFGKTTTNEVLNTLKRLEYRGYDSFGIVTENFFEKEIGQIHNLKNNDCNIAISHTRWATHGGVTKENSHPHYDCNEKIFIVHNGILENYKELKSELENKGHIFRSQTDSEVIAHFLEEKRKTKSMTEGIKDFFNEAKGEFAIIAFERGIEKLYAFKSGSPMVMGLDDKRIIISSDIFSFSNKTNKSIFFNENELAVIDKYGYTFFQMPKLLEIKKEIKTVDWSSDLEGTDKYDHYMIKEIMETPIVSKRLIDSLKNEQKNKLYEIVSMIKNSKRIVFIAAGTSYHASLIGCSLLAKAGIEAHAVIASEFNTFTLLDGNTLVIAVSQSGETMDVIQSLHGIKEKGVKIASFVNVPYSTIQRMSNLSINICAGQEICVASTKAFINQVICLAQIASILGYKTEVDRIPLLLEKALKNEDQIKEIAENIKDKKDLYIIGRGFCYPVAREIALKLKEIAYMHAEGMMGGELKHGTLALIEQNTPVIALMPLSDNNIESNAKEVEARGANVIAFSENSEFKNKIKIDAVDKASFALVAAILGMLLTYHIAKLLKKSIDKPRNIAKCVTVR